MPDWMYIWPSGLMTKRPSNPVEPATNVLMRDADAANLRTDSLAALGLARVPVEHLGALIKRLLDERARRVAALTARIRRAELRLSFRRVDLADRDLIDAELPRGLRDDRLHQHDPLHAARLALRARAAACWSAPKSSRKRIASG